MTWLEEAACAASLTPHAWHSDSAELTTVAIQTCHRSLVREPCLLYALAVEDPAGVWGGLSARPRRALLRRRDTTGRQR